MTADKIKSGLIGFMFLFLLSTQFFHGRETRNLEHALDTLASNEILRRAADSLQWETQVATVTDNLQGELRGLSSENGDLADRTLELVREIESLEGRVATATEVNVNLMNALRTDAVTFASTDTAEALPDSIAAPYDDGLLSGRIAYYPPVSQFGLEYGLDIALSMVSTELPDGRWSVMARAEDGRVNLTIPQMFVKPAPPAQYCSVMTRGKWGAGGYLLRLLQAALTGG